MVSYTLSNSNIDLACEEVGKFLADAGVERREALRTRLMFEEVLLKYQNKFGTEAIFKVKQAKRLSSIKVELLIPGESLYKDGADDDIIRNLLAGIGLAPTWNYKNGQNQIIFTQKRNSVSGTAKMVAAIALAIVTGLLLNLLPSEIRTAANNYLLTPATNAFTGLISAVSGPLIFLSVLGSICSMGNLETLGKIGSKTFKALFFNMALVSIPLTALASLFYRVEWGTSGTSSFTQVMDLVYDIIPSNLFEPFVTGNTLQLMFIAVIVGLSMLVLSARVNAVFDLVTQFSAIAQTIMAAISYMLPVLIYVLFTGMISSGNSGTILGSWKSLLVIVLLTLGYYVVKLLRVAAVKKISPALLWKKTMPTFMICLTTASSAAAFTTNVHDTQKKLGIDKQLVEFATPLGQVLFKPGYLAMLIGTELCLAEACNIPITLPWLFIALITNLLVSFAVPPIPGGAAMGFAVVFAQLGIPVEMMAIAIALNALPDFPATAVNICGWQLSLIEVADSVHMLDPKTLHKSN